MKSWQTFGLQCRQQNRTLPSNAEFVSCKTNRRAVKQQTVPSIIYNRSGWRTSCKTLFLGIYGAFLALLIPSSGNAKWQPCQNNLDKLRHRKFQVGDSQNSQNGGSFKILYRRVAQMILFKNFHLLTTEKENKKIFLIQCFIHTPGLKTWKQCLNCTCSFPLTAQKAFTINHL